MFEKVEKVIGLVERIQKLGVPLSQIILLSSAGVAYWTHGDWLRQHWRLTLLIILLYEFFILLLIFSRALLRFIKELWKEEFKQDALKVSATWLRAVPHKVAPGFARRYRKQVIIDHEVFNVRGLGLIHTFTLKLDQVFVDLKISPSSNPNRLNLNPIAVEAFAEARNIWDFIRASNNRAGDAIALAIVGPPGCGKTTLLQHVAVTLAANWQRRFKVPAYIPLLLFLREHAALITDNPNVSLGQLAQQIFTGDRYPVLKTPPNWFERQLHRGKVLVLLDGLDEVAQTERRQAVSNWVERQLRTYPQCRFVITSRPQGYTRAPLQRAHVVEVQPFSGEQVRCFIGNWYLANEVVSAGNKVNEGVRQRARAEAADLLKRLSNPKAAALNTLTVNPLLLTMIAMVHRYRGALPGSRVELYREICEVLLGRWRQARGVQDDVLTADQKRVVLMPLAARMMEREVREISTADALAIIKPHLRRVGVTGESQKSFLQELQASSGLLLERERDSWSFAHLTFQEYLTAFYWLAEKKPPVDLSKLVEKSWWHETLRLYAAQGDATQILEACLAANNVPSLTLAAEIMDEGAREIREDVHNAAIARITAALESPDETLRRLAAEVQLSRRLSLTNSNSMRRVDNLREIDTTYITWAEYQLFLHEMLEQGRYVQPDHWLSLQFASGQARASACGVRPEDAIDFCQWLTQRQGGTIKYRLPTLEEARQYPAIQTEIGGWCQQNQLLMTERHEQELRQYLAQLSKTPLLLKTGINLDPSCVRPLVLKLSLTRQLEEGLAADLARALVRDISQPHNSALTYVFNAAYTERVNLKLDRARELHRKLERALNHTYKRGTDPQRDLECAHELKLQLERARELNHVFVNDHKRHRKLDRALELANELLMTRNRTRELANDVAGELERELSHSRTQERERDRSLSEDLDKAVKRARELIDNPIDTGDDYGYGLNYANEQTITYLLDQAHELNNKLVEDYELEIGRTLTRALTDSSSGITQVCELTTKVISEIAHYQELDRRIDEILQEAQVYTRELQFESILDFNNALEQAIKIDHELVTICVAALELARTDELNRVRYIEQALALVRARAFHRLLLLDLHRKSGRPLKPVPEVEHIYTQMQKLLEVFALINQPAGVVLIIDLVFIISALDLVAQAQTVPEWQRAYRRYAAQLLSYADLDYNQAMVEPRLSWWQKGQQLGHTLWAESAQQTSLDSYWWLQLVVLRADDRLPAWEGIRLFRERMAG